jgi:excisionase family DNA binding protein
MKRSDGLPLYLTPDEVADLLRTSRKAIYTMIERRQLPGVTRIGRRLLIRAPSLLQWLDDQQGADAAAKDVRR